MHQAILPRAERNPEILAKAKLRFIRSSSASLPAQVMLELEKTFGAPVIESYGMTEATHQMASNPLPPAPRKPGSVGIAAGPLVRICDDAGAFLPAGAEGEVVISGPNVTPGYEANPDANLKGFFEAEGRRWFRTGDQGVMDEEGYLRITGRLKEIINRGGEKVSPLEVDEVLMDHPAVAQVVTFAMPHAKLGEEVACAVVLREGMVVVEQEIRTFASGRLADFKVPRKVVILEEIPKGATGKLQRIGLAQKLGPRRVRICIYGAGAIGGLLGARLAKAGAEVSLVARGPHLAAMREKGLTLRSAEETFTVRPAATDDPASLGAAGLCRRSRSRRIRCRAWSAPMQPLLGPDTAVVMGVNGVPWWYFHGLGGAVRGPAAAQRRPRRRAVGRHRPGARDRLRRLPGGRGARARRDRAGRGRPLHPGRALGRADRAHRAPVPGPDRRRPQGAGPRQDPRRDLGQALGQPLLQPDQRAHRRHPRRDLRRPRHARRWPAP